MHGKLKEISQMTGQILDLVSTLTDSLNSNEISQKKGSQCEVKSTICIISSLIKKNGPYKSSNNQNHFLAKLDKALEIINCSMNFMRLNMQMSWDFTS